MFYLHSEDVAVLLGALEISSIHPRVQMRKVVPWNAHSHGPPECCWVRTPMSQPQSDRGGISDLYSGHGINGGDMDSSPLRGWVAGGWKCKLCL